ncbi:hypothetical protein RP300_00372 [Oligella urethralis]|uniref:Uncharacterized protein n=1 Tax=Oligella urethralis TaxID=90245 RepID=A0A2X1UQE6_9BURK|nr:hypothetical protein RP300_00372 [Oligella urethralis]SPY09248.1 Uncharacterised protein [Oligella urethralis]SUA53452.1 Uncharacterised protein [Oligella urethralis]SUA62733.1 Uncharacterised protein [Oligella urethralis]SUA64178.1 Uncharacterised protein [Oligella urethralis]
MTTPIINVLAKKLKNQYLIIKKLSRYVRFPRDLFSYQR